MATQENPLYRYRPGVPSNTGEYYQNLPTTESGLPSWDTNPSNDIHDMFYNNAGIINAFGNQINNTGQSQLNYYGPRQVQQAGLIDQSLQQLNQTPGYTPGEESRIGVDYGQYRTPDDYLDAEGLKPWEEDAMKQGYINAENKAGEGNAAQGAMLNQYQANLGGQFENYGKSLNGALVEYGAGLDKSLGKLDSGLNAAQGKFQDLRAAVNDPSLQFDPNGTQKQLTDADVEAIKTAAGRRVGNSYQSAKDDILRRAAADGTTSPAAVGAMLSRLASRSAADQGDSEADANIKALQAQYDRAAGIDRDRINAAQTQAGMRANAATTEQSQAQNAAALSGTTGVNAADTYGQSKVNSANTYGQAGLDTATQYGQFSANTAGQMGDRAAAAATNTAANQNNVILNNQQSRINKNATRYNQGMQTAQATSQGAQTTGNARIAGQNAYRQGVTEQQGMAQQGGQKAVDQQNTAFGTTTGGLVGNADARAQFESRDPGALGKTGNALLNFVKPSATGGMATEDEPAILGERGPEMVYGRYGAKMVDRPIMAMLEEGDTVVPLNTDPKNKASMRYRQTSCQ